MTVLKKIKFFSRLCSRRRAMFLIAVFLFMAAAAWLIKTDPALAAGIDELANTSWWMRLLAGIMLTVGELCLKMALFFLSFIIQVAGYNGYLKSTAVEIGWVMVRDIANMLFVIILLVIAFGTILGIEQYEWKKLLVKFILAAVLVNFSRLICGVFIDIAQVVMITFVNGVAATAGGNLINAFNLNEITKLSPDATPGGIDNTSLFVASLGGLFFSAMVMAAMAVFVFMLVARLIVLWVLIVLSPLAFVLSVVPQTQKYASEWWTNFGNNVISGPVLLFFIWLAFVTVGGGNINEEISRYSAVPETSKIGAEAESFKSTGAGGQSAGISSAMSWVNMANFAIAIGMLLVGAKVTQQLGVIGGTALGGAIDFGKKIAMTASGLAAARWAGQRGLAAGKAAGKFALMKAPLVGGEAWVRRGKAIQIGALGAAEAWNKAIGGKEAGAIGRIFQVGRHAKVMKERERQVEAMRERMGSATNVENLKRQTDALEGQGEMRKAASEAKRKGFRAEAALTYLQTPEGEKYTEKMKEAERKETELTQAKSELEKAYTEGRGGAKLAEAKAKVAKVQLELGVAQKEAEHLAEGVVGLPAARAEAKQAEEKIAADKQLAELQKTRELLEGRGAATQEEIYTKKAAIEQVTFDMGELREQDVARARDTFLRGEGKDSEAVNLDNVLAKQTKARIERQSVGDYTLAMDRIGAQQRRVANLEAANDPKAIQARRSLSEMQMAAEGKHSIFAEGSIGKILSAAGMSAEHSMQLDKDSIRQLQAQWLASKIGQPVEATSTGLNSALQNFRDLHGNKAEAMLEQSRLAMENAGGQGSVWLSGLLRTKIDADGRKRTELTDVDDTTKGEGLEYIAGRRVNATSGSKLTSLAGGVSGLVDRTASGKAIVKSPASVDMLSKVLTPLTGNMLTNVDEYVKQDLAAIFANSEQGALAALIDKVKVGASDKKAISKLLTDVLSSRMEEATSEARSGLQMFISEIDKAIKDEAAKEKPTAKPERGGTAGTKPREYEGGVREIEVGPEGPPIKLT